MLGYWFLCLLAHGQVNFTIARVVNRGSETLQILDAGGVSYANIRPCASGDPAECGVTIALPQGYGAEYRRFDDFEIAVTPAISHRDGEVLVFYPFEEPQTAFFDGGFKLPRLAGPGAASFLRYMMVSFKK